MKDISEKDNNILCPICGKERFSQDDHFIFCNMCGWEGNINNDDNIVELNGYSARDYRKVYQEYLKQNPNYIWKKDKNALEKFMDSFVDYGSKCPVCGEDSFEPDYRFCYKCGWRYSFIQAQYPDFDNSSNKLSLNQYKEKYKSLITNNNTYMWKNTNEAKIQFNTKQLKWLEDNNINYNIDKLSLDKEINNTIDSIERIQRKYENKEDYETYMFIKSILDLILDVL
jgi:ribosomal protein L37E